LFVKKSTAVNLAADLHERFNTNCVEVHIEIRIGSIVPTQELKDKKYLECNKLVSEIDALNNHEVELVSKTKYRKYLKARQYVREYTESNPMLVKKPVASLSTNDLLHSVDLLS